MDKKIKTENYLAEVLKMGEIEKHYIPASTLKHLMSLQEYLNEQALMRDKILKASESANVYTIPNSKEKGGREANYQYFVYPYKGVSPAQGSEEQFLAKIFSRFIKNIDLLVTFDSDGISITSHISAVIGIPYIVCKPFHYEIRNRISFSQQTGYFKRDLFFDLENVKNKRIAIVDCMISTGGTISSFIKTCQKYSPSTHIEGVYVVMNKTTYRKNSLAINFSKKIPVVYLFEGDIVSKKVVMKPSVYFRRSFWMEINNKINAFAEDVSLLSTYERNSYRIGALIIDNFSLEILGWGHKHHEIHAEVAALKMAQERFKDFNKKNLTLYTSLEPCTYRNIKKAVSCVEIINNTKNIYWVVIGSLDTEDKKINGKGIKKLAKAGKNVVLLWSHPSKPIVEYPSLT